MKPKIDCWKCVNAKCVKTDFEEYGEDSLPSECGTNYDVE